MFDWIICGTLIWNCLRAGALNERFLRFRREEEKGVLIEVCVIGDPIDFPSSFQSCCNDFILVAGGVFFPPNIVAERNNKS